MRKLLSFISAFLLLHSFSFAQGSGCPEVIAGPDQVLPCTQTCTQLTATPFNVGETNVYTVNPIPHTPPIAYNQAGGTAISVNTDDVWSNVINLPFPFCYFGTSYNQVSVASNGALKLTPPLPAGGSYHDWQYTASLPSTVLAQRGDIFGPYHDIDPSVAGRVRWYFLGAAPCRIFVVVYDNLGHFSCTNLRSSHMVVLYETTNVIEVYVRQKLTCNSWNSGNTVIGIQNGAGTVSYTPPGRNTGNWTVTTPEAWQFVPSGNPINSSVEWFNGTTSIGTGNSINVCPTGNTTYTARTTYTRCDGLQINTEDQVNVGYTPPPSISLTPQNPLFCSGSGNVTITATVPGTVNYNWSVPAGNVSSINVSPSATTTYSVTATDVATGCSSTNSTTVTIVTPSPNVCNVLYASPTGLATNDGTKASPLSLSEAILKAACFGTVVKLAIGTYLIDNPITTLTDNIILEGGFDPANGWRKTSLAGATTIRRSINNVEGATGSAPRLTAIEANGVNNFRLQDITISTDNAPANTAGNFGISTYALLLNNCRNYNLVRTQLLAGNGGVGSSGAPGSTGANGPNGNDGSGRNGGAAPAGPNAGGAGGRGGGGGVFSGNSGNNGSAGNGSNPGAGGGGGGGATGCAATFGNNSNYGSPGTNGGNGTNGTAGTLGAPGAFLSGFYQPGSQGINGTNGISGSGGGGGGGNGGAGVGTDGGGGGSGGSGGVGGSGGNGGFGGGASLGLTLVNNGIGGNLLDCNISSGAFGIGGTGGAGGQGGQGGTGGQGATDGTGGVCDNNPGDGGSGGSGGSGGAGGSGADGITCNIYHASGQPISLDNNGTIANITATGCQSSSNFNLIAQATITQDDIACTNTNVNYSAAANGNWTFQTGTPPTANASNTVNVTYASTGRKNVTYDLSGRYSGFSNILVVSNLKPDLATDAPLINGIYRVCQGNSANVWVQNGGVGYVYNWQVLNASSGTSVGNFNGAQFDSIAYTFNTTDSLLFVLTFETNCCSGSQADTIKILVDPAPNITSVQASANSLCPNDLPITITATVTNAATYSWTPSAGILSGANTPVVVVRPIATTTYVLTATSLGGTCFDTANYNIVANQHSVSINTVPVTCNTLGSATATVVANNPDLTYSWSTGVANGPTASLTNTINNLPAGIYTVTVVNSNTGCVDSVPFIVSPDPNSFYTVINNATPVTCFGLSNGTATVQSFNPVGAVNHVWTDSAGVNTVNPNALGPGWYLVTSTDGAGCVFRNYFLISEPRQIVIDSVRGTNPICFKFGGGSLEVLASGGSGQFTYSWSVAPAQDSSILLNVDAGCYTVTATDFRNCSASATYCLSAPSHNISIATVVDDIKCNGTQTGTVTVNPTGSNPGFSYVWSPNVSAINTATNLGVGSYSVTVRDALGCEDTITVNMTQRNALSSTVTSDPVNCFGFRDGRIAISNVSGGTGPYTYSVNGSNFTDTAIYTGLNIGTYPVVIRDAFGCEQTSSVVITQPDSLGIRTLVDTIYQIPGIDNYLEVIPSLSTGVTYDWTPDNTLSCDDCPRPIVNDQANTLHTVTATYTPNNLPCTSSTGVYVIVPDKEVFVMPTAFSPNADNANDLYYPVIFGQTEFVSVIEFRVYNRWGQIVYNDPSKGWDGKFKGESQPVETYVYHIKVRLPDPNNIGQTKDVVKSGTFSLLR
jgi:gliding motility-associated-like protein